MKPVTFEQLPDAVLDLYEKMDHIEQFIRKRSFSYKSNYFSQNGSLHTKCSSHLNKSDLAQFFYILMDENILFFDDRNEKHNRSMMQKFLQENFTYRGDSGLQVSIETVSKQFSESKGYTYGDKQLLFLDKIIFLFQKRKEKLVSK
jgi:hypothetical protein